MQEVEKRAKETERRKQLNILCSRSALLLSVVSCIALIHVELRIKENHRLISHSVTSCDQMETEILRKLQPHNYNNWQATKESHLGGDWQEILGIKWRQLLFLSFCTAIYCPLVVRATKPASKSSNRDLSRRKRCVFVAIYRKVKFFLHSGL